MRQPRSNDAAACVLRDLCADIPGELELVVKRSMQTVLETIPELGGSEQRARELLPNFDATAMREMYARDLQRPSTHRLVVAEVDGALVGHVIYFLRPDAHDLGPSGYVFTIYVDPPHRRAGIAYELLGHAVSWLGAQGARVITAHTHVDNQSFLRLATRHAFRVTERLESPWPHWALVR